MGDGNIVVMPGLFSLVGVGGGGATGDCGGKGKCSVPPANAGKSFWFLYADAAAFLFLLLFARGTSFCAWIILFLVIAGAATPEC